MAIISTLFSYLSGGDRSHSDYSKIKKDDDYLEEATSGFIASLPSNTDLKSGDTDLLAKTVVRSLTKLEVNDSNKERVYCALKESALQNRWFHNDLIKHLSKLNEKRKFKDLEIQSIVLKLISDRANISLSNKRRIIEKMRDDKKELKLEKS